MAGDRAFQDAVVRLVLHDTKLLPRLDGDGKLRQKHGRMGKFFGYRPDWKKAWVRLKAGEKMPEYAEI